MKIRAKHAKSRHAEHLTECGISRWEYRAEIGGVKTISCHRCLQVKAARKRAWLAAHPNGNGAGRRIPDDK